MFRSSNSEQIHLTFVTLFMRLERSGRQNMLCNALRHQMRKFQLLTWFLLGYLVILTNFGPSFHRLHLLGIHPPTDAVASPCGCSCSHHSIDFASNEFVQSFHECAFCKFFDECNLAVCTFDFFLESTVSVQTFVRGTSDVDPVGVFAVARAPPTL